MRISHAHPHTGYELNGLICRSPANNAWHSHSSWLVKMSSSLPLAWSSLFYFPFHLFLFKFPPFSLPFTPDLTSPLASAPISAVCFPRPSFFTLFSSLKPPLCSQPSLWLVQPWHGGYWTPAKFWLKNTAIFGQTFSPYKWGWCFSHGKSSHPLRPQAKKKKIAKPQCVALGGQRCEALSTDRNKSGVSENCETRTVDVSS